MVQLTRSETGTILRTLVWRTDTDNKQNQAVRLFQGAYNLGAPLKVDGIVGPATSAALLRSHANHKAGRPDISPHFSINEFDCTCGGRYKACARMWTERKLLVGLEKYRAKLIEHGLANSVKVISGCRCVGRNREIPGAAVYSQHTLGRAADIAHVVRASTLAGWGCGFTGIGKRASDGEACHVDVRHSGFAIWVYSTW